MVAELTLENRLKEQGLLVGVITAKPVVITESSDELKQLILQATETMQGRELDQRRSAVRDLLRQGGFKPCGRNKPASEYLIQAAKEQRFPVINNLVDINNLISVKYSLPASILDSDVVGQKLIMRLGLPDEQYVFNRSGQEINLSGLICACGISGEAEAPLGNPIKDSMKAKLSENSAACVAIVYAPISQITPTEMKDIANEFSDLLARFASARDIAVIVE